jgi:RNA polymerase sigma-70 factor (ECF subfamily)
LDPKIVADCYRDYGEMLRRYVYGMVRDVQRANDIVQTAFVRLAERGGEVEATKLRPWLYRVAYNEAMLARRQDAAGERAGQRAAWSQTKLPEDAIEELVRVETIEQVRVALDRLPPRLREVVRLRIYEEKTFAAIAEELKIPLGTALTRMRTALQQLKLTLADGWKD